ncbi:hypothetical protein CFP56_031250 [Quercus suber]|uniref:Uncharacterized protein n=1 Tax=Quercus suber TaxID=58331 RepID=A0AAW0JJS2_QUESU
MSFYLIFPTKSLPLVLQQAQRVKA